MPEIFHVNWFRQDSDDNFLWPGFGDNLRVLRWIIDRCEGKVGANETPIGFLPNAEDMDLVDLDIDAETMASLIHVDKAQWREELQNVAEYFDEFGERMPAELRDQQARVLKALG